MVTKTFRFLGHDGKPVEVTVEASTWTALESMERQYRREEERYRQRHRQLSGEQAEGLADRGSYGSRGDAWPWEGPRPYRFDLLLGASPVWSGPGSLVITADMGRSWQCRFCGHLPELPPGACCLGCQRTGRDGEIGRPSELDLKRRAPGRTKFQEHPKLAGGRGKSKGSRKAGVKVRAR